MSTGYRFTATTLLGALLVFVPSVRAANIVNASRVVITEPLTDQDVRQAVGEKRWPRIEVRLGTETDVATFASLARLPGLRHLSISRDAGLASFEDIPPLKDLAILNAVSLPQAKNTPLSARPLSRFTSLTVLNVFGTPLSDLDALGACTRLRRLNFYQGRVDSLEFLRHTPLVDELNLYGTQHTFPSYAPITTLTRLRSLDIYMNPQATDENLAVLRDLKSLRDIHLSNSRQVTTLDFLANCVELEEVKANWCRTLIDIAALTDKALLRTVELSSAKISDLRPFANKPHLETLDLDATRIADLTPLGDCPQLRKLDLSKTAVTDLGPLARLRRLESLDLSGTAVADLSPLGRITSLRGLILDNTAVTDLAPLAGLDRLTSLSIDRTAVKDLSPLQSLGNLKRLKLARSVPPDQIDALAAALPELEIQLE